MQLYQIHQTQRLPISIQDAWQFFSDPSNLRHITPPTLRFEVTSAPAARMYPGMIITYRITPIWGITRQWITEITHVIEPHLFVDEQRFGPYRFWHHQHLFREIAGGVEMQDVVHYAIPFGWLGRLLAARIVHKELQKIFEFRRDFLVQQFGSVA
jgi:ligand-binding SRPBCC domain-containing protein